MCVYGVVLINILVLQLGPPNKNSWLRPWACVHFFPPCYMLINQCCLVLRDWWSRWVFFIVAQADFGCIMYRPLIDTIEKIRKLFLFLGE